LAGKAGYDEQGERYPPQPLILMAMGTSPAMTVRAETVRQDPLSARPIGFAPEIDSDQCIRTSSVGMLALSAHPGKTGKAVSLSANKHRYPKAKNTGDA
jgi:hypothetical protein